MTDETFNELRDKVEADEVLILVKRVNSGDASIFACGSLDDVVTAAAKTIAGATEKSDKKLLLLIDAVLIFSARIREMCSPDGNFTIPLWNFGTKEKAPEAAATAPSAGQ